MKRLRCYIAGPMTGLPDLNFPAFHSAAAKLRAAGIDAVNPAEICPDQSKTWSECMRADIRELVTCDAIVLLDGWWKSRGASIEFMLANVIGMRIAAIEELVAEQGQPA